MKTTSLSFVENKESRVSSVNQEVIDTTSVAVRNYKVGNIYRYANHTFAVWAKGSWKNETTGKVSNHVVFAVTFDGGSQEQYLDSEGIKQKIGDERRAVRATSMDSNGKVAPVADLDVCMQKANNAYKAELAAIATLQKRFGKHIVEDVAELCNICVSNTAAAMYAAAKEKERKAIAAKKETKEFAANVASNKATIDEIKSALETEQAKEQPDTQKITELTKKLLALL